jgi:hypothetical protein
VRGRRDSFQVCKSALVQIGKSGGITHLPPLKCGTALDLCGAASFESTAAKS